uniref:Uncharacterized protein n=1 Tax=Romanomermis culicivorax TaxID=13658 RepID=A0A915L3C7_ROMCU
MINDGGDDDSRKIPAKGGDAMETIGEGGDGTKIVGEGCYATKIVGEGGDARKIFEECAQEYLWENYKLHLQCSWHLGFLSEWYKINIIDFMS